jgi:hypothetical protein
MPELTSRDLAARMSKRLANFDLNDATIEQLAGRVLIDGLKISRFDPCIYGICIDYYTDRLPNLNELSIKHGISKWEVFPYGIIEWDHFRVRVAFDVNELEDRLTLRGFQS